MAGFETATDAHRGGGCHACPGFLQTPRLTIKFGAQPSTSLCCRPVQPLRAPRTERALSEPLHACHSSFAGSRGQRRQLLGKQQRSLRSLLSSPVALLPFQKPEDRPLGIVVTGGSKGVGFALAASFLSAGDNVVICSRDVTPGRLAAAVDALNKHSVSSAKEGKVPGRAFGVKCNVAVPSDVEALAVSARDSLGGRIDGWVNNAAQVGSRGRIVDLAAEDIVGVVSTNLLGTLLCCRKAEQVMRESGGHVFSMDGAGSGGNATATYVAYGSTKRAIPQMVASLAKELRGGKVRFHVLSPGMVLTDLLLSGNASDKSSLRFFNFLAEEPETVASGLAPRIRAIVLRDGGGSEYVKFLTLPRAFLQIAGGFLFGIRANRYFDRDGKRVGNAQELFNENGVRKQYTVSDD